jgi:putative addiction module killer protein
MIEVVEYVDGSGRSPFRAWFDGLDARAAAIVTTALSRLADGNTSNVAPIGSGAAEVKIDRGPGYRIYFGWDRRTLVVLLGGGTKRRGRATSRTQ